MEVDLIGPADYAGWPDQATIIADLRQGLCRNGSALSPECGGCHAEISAALPNEMGRIGQTDAQSYSADTDVIEPRFTQHPARDRDPAVVQQAAKRQA